MNTDLIRKILNFLMALIVFLLWVTLFSNGSLASNLVSFGVGWLLGTNLFELIFFNWINKL
jgi:hypothetical protein